MKCPHCERTWDPSDLGSPVLIPENVLREHISRFCPGAPAGSPASRRRAPASSHLVARPLRP